MAALIRMRWSDYRRTALGLVLGLWIILLALTTARSVASGPHWGLRLTPSDSGQVLVSEARKLSVAEDQIGVGAEILAVDGDDAHLFVERDLTFVSDVAFRAVDGSVGSIHIDVVSAPHLALLVLCSLLFLLLGSLVHRWAADPLLGRLFLLLSAAFATVLTTVPAAVLGHAWAMLLMPAAGLLAASSLVGLFVVFPRRLPHAARVICVMLAVTGGLACAQVVSQAVEAETSQLLDLLSSLWLISNLLGGVVLIGLRTRHRSDRRALAPLLFGTAVGVAPVALLFLVPMILRQPTITSPHVLISTAAIPISFAYSILRYRVFGLDALMRRVLLRASATAVGVGVFYVAWQGLLMAGLTDVEAVVTAALVASLLAPTVTKRTSRLIDRWLYSPFVRVLGARESLDADSPQALGDAIAQRARQVVPIAWAACVVIDESGVSNDNCRILGADGQVPPGLARPLNSEDLSTMSSVVPIRRAERVVGLLLAGPRVDGVSLSALELEVMQVLAHDVAPRVDAALLRERAQDEVRFRQGVTGLTHDLSAAGTVQDVLRSAAEHACKLLKADSVEIWRCGVDGPIAIIDTEATDQSDTVKDLLASSGGREAVWVAIGAGGHALAFSVGHSAGVPDVCMVTRTAAGPSFSSRDAHRAREISEHVSVAARRAAEREDLEDQLRHQAFNDSLTGLPNRALFLDRVEHSRARAERFGLQLAVLFIDLDRFKVINDSLGHGAGDQLLLEVAGRLRDCLSDPDTIARLGGDEFAVLIESQSALDDAVLDAERVSTVLRTPFELDSQEAYVSASIGIASSSPGTEPDRDLMREADIALHRAKAAGRAQFAIFEDRMSRIPTAHLHLESELHRAIERGELRVHYQPIFALSDGRITGMEALVRWAHPQKGLVPPGDFIPLAEDTGLIVPIGKWVLEEACRRMRQWHVEYPALPPMSVSVNLSARQFQDPHLITHIEQAVRSAHLDARWLQLEITESAVMHDAEAAIAKLHALKALGIHLAMDDFGTGYSSLAYLKRFPIDVLKIDRSFVSGLIDGEHDLAIVQNVIGLAKALHLTTTAEGIEEKGQWMILKQLGCDAGQGYIFSRPQAAEDLADLLNEEDAPTTRAA